VKSKLCLIMAGMTLAFANSASAGDASGKWTAQVPGRDGQTRETTFNFKVEGEALTGTVSGRQGDMAITGGTIKGDDLSFNVTASFGGNDVKLVYKGKIEGDEIKLTRQREGSDQTQAFTAQRAK
jgi:hypothetical protein